MSDPNEQELAALVARFAKQKETAEGLKLKAFEGLLNEISAALSDVVQVLQKPRRKEEDAALTAALQSIAAAVSKLRIEAPAITFEPRIEVSPAPVSAPAPRIDVNVSPAPIQNNVTVPTPEVHVHERPAPRRIELEFHYAGDRITGATIVKGE